MNINLNQNEETFDWDWNDEKEGFGYTYFAAKEFKQSNDSEIVQVINSFVKFYGPFSRSLIIYNWNGSYFHYLCISLLWVKSKFTIKMYNN